MTESYNIYANSIDKKGNRILKYKFILEVNKEEK